MKNTKDDTNSQEINTTQTTKKRYLVASRRGSIALQSGVKPTSSFELKNHIQNFSNINIVKTLRQQRGFSPQSVSINEAREVHLVEMSAETHSDFSKNSPEHILIEEEQHLDFLDTVSGNEQVPARRFSLTKIASTINFEFLVLGEDDKPLSDVNIQLSSNTSAQEAITSRNGSAKISLQLLPGTQVETLFAKAKTLYWDLFLKTPNLSTDSVNVIRLKSLSETIPNFPLDYRFGWGSTIMGLPEQDKKLTGKGVKIAIIDSGLGNHDLLSHVVKGYDLTTKSPENSWHSDSIGHGTHVSGVITANGQDNKLRGFCPEAEIIVIKVFPGGTSSALLEAIDICIEQGVDIANLSLGTPDVSLIIEQKIEEAVLSGVAMIVAAGNDGGPVQFPANSPNTLAVSAIGTTTEVRENTWDASQISADLTAKNGIFSPTFTSNGPEVDVSGPGVAIVSTGPENSYFPDSGTSMAAPHITGLAGLLVAHHPAFKSSYIARNNTRVAALYNLLRQISFPMNFGPGRTGVGLPNIQTVANQLIATPSETPKTNGATPPSTQSLPYYYVVPV